MGHRAKPTNSVRKQHSKPERLCQQNLAPVISPPTVRVKKKPRGKSFEPGNCFGSEHRFKKGICPNPGGRAKSHEISVALRELLKSESKKPLSIGIACANDKYGSHSVIFSE
jgi:hypothetical protein